MHPTNHSERTTSRFRASVTPLRLTVLGILTTLAFVSHYVEEALLQAVGLLQHPLVTASLGWITSFRSLFAVLFILPGLFLWENRKSAWISSLSIAFIASALSAFVAKILLDRRRPYGIPGTFGDWDSSFPSGHVAIAFAGATVLSLVYPRLRGFWYTYASLVAVGRVYLGMHYASDVLGGSIVGLCSGFIVCAMLAPSISAGTAAQPIPIPEPTQPAEYLTEFRRKMLHMVVGIGIVLLHRSQVLSIFELFLILVIGIGISFASTRYKVPVVYWFLERFERKHTHPGKGAITFIIGVILALKLFTPDIAYAAITILALGDGFSAIIGPLGATKTFLSRTKLIEGTAAGILLGFIGASIFVGTFEALSAATVAMVLEATELKLNNKILSDNILVPLVAGTVIVLLRQFV